MAADELGGSNPIVTQAEVVKSQGVLRAALELYKERTGLAPAIGKWTGAPAVAELVRWLLLPIATKMAASVSIAMLERRLAFSEVGAIEIFAQLANYVVALPLVMVGWSDWGPITGNGADCRESHFSYRRHYDLCIELWSGAAGARGAGGAAGVGECGDGSPPKSRLAGWSVVGI